MQGLDEVQSYVLLRRWLLRSSDEVVGGVLLPAQRAALAAEYALERLCLLKCLEGLLLHHYATAGGDAGAPRDMAGAGANSLPALDTSGALASGRGLAGGCGHAGRFPCNLSWPLAIKRSKPSHPDSW